MTAANGSLPKIVLAVGAPDGMTGAARPTQRFDGRQRLHGISGISTALLPWLHERAPSVRVLMFGGGGPLDAGDARGGWLEQTGGDVLVNLICEPEAQRLALHQVARFELETQLPLGQPVWAVAATTRPLIARRLAHQAGVRAPHCTLVPGRRA